MYDSEFGGGTQAPRAWFGGNLPPVVKTLPSVNPQEFTFLQQF